MKEISEYDNVQLKLMLQSITSFHRNYIELNSLIGTLDFLLRAVEFVDEEWDEKFLDEVIDLETINAIEINNENGEEYIELDPEEKEEGVHKTVCNLKNLIEAKLNK